MNSVRNPKSSQTVPVRKMKISNGLKVAIIQARIGSTRLPGKVLKKINGKSMLEQVINRVKLAKKVDKVVLAIPDTSKDDVLLKLAKGLNTVCIRGSEKNVLSRFLKAAKETKAKIIVRITGDCPLIDPRIIDRTISIFKEESCDYLVQDVTYGGYPRGFDTEIFFLETLTKAARLAKRDYHREHVTISIYEHPEIFKIRYYKAPKKFYRPNLRLCVDEPIDLIVVRKIFKHFKPREDFTAQEIIEYLDKNPQIAAINKDVRQKTK